MFEKVIFTLFISLSVVSSTFAQRQKTVLITYYSKTSSTKAMAEEVAKGAGTVSEVKVVLKNIDATSMQDLLEADAIILGSPVYNANVAPEVLEFIRKWPFENQAMKDKLGAVFVSAGGMSSGEELVQANLLHAMMIFGMVVMGGEEWTAAFGASAVTHESPFDINQQKKIDPVFLKKGYGLGKRVAEWTKKIK